MFADGDLVWAKMKSYPFWPSQIAQPETGVTTKKGKHYVFFLGSKNFAWIPDDMIKPHTEEMVLSCNTKRYPQLAAGVDEIKQLALTMKPKSPDVRNDTASVSNELSPSKSPVKKKVKISQAKRSPQLQSKKSTSKQIVGKKRFSSDKADILSSPHKALKLDDESSSLNVFTPSSHKEHSRIAVIRPLDEDIKPTSIAMRKIKKKTGGKHVDPSPKKIGFIGLGAMGHAIVNNLLKSKHHVTVWNRTPEKCSSFIKDGAMKAETPAALVMACDIIFCCVSDPSASKRILFGNYGVLQGFEDSKASEKGYVEMTTMDEETSQGIEEAIIVKGGKYLEAPIIGSQQLADEGALTILASGSRSLFKDCEPCFHAMSQHAYYISEEVGKSTNYNLIISMFMGTSYAALGEAMALADRINVSQRDFLEILKYKDVMSKIIMDKGKAILDRNFTTKTTSIRHQQKDMTLALQLSQSHIQPMQVTAQANELYLHARLLGYSDLDVSAVYNGIRY